MQHQAASDYDDDPLPAFLRSPAVRPVIPDRKTDDLAVCLSIAGMAICLLFASLRAALFLAVIRSGRWTARAMFMPSAARAASVCLGLGWAAGIIIFSH